MFEPQSLWTTFSKEIQAIDPTKLHLTMEEIEAKERAEHMIAQCKNLQPNSPDPTSLFELVTNMLGKDEFTRVNGNWSLL
jgi:hypothetical protein